MTGQQPTNISAYPGDEIFFHHRGQPKAGKVLAAGAHGCTVHDGEKEHKLKYEHIAGFKKRQPQRYHVVDQGEDGLIVQDANKRRRYVGIPPEARQERLELETQKARKK